MQIPEDGYLLRIFIGESDRHGHHPLYEAIVLKAREAGLAGVTVTRGVMGFGNTVFYTRQKSCDCRKIYRWSLRLPIA
jgi:PII-like signaling protein